MNALFPIFLFAFFACVSGQFYGAANTRQPTPGLEKRLNTLTQLANLLKEGVQSSKAPRSSSVRPLHLFKDRPRSPQEEYEEERERYWTRKVETFLDKEDMNADGYYADADEDYEGEEYLDYDDDDFDYDPSYLRDMGLYADVTKQILEQPYDDMDLEEEAYVEDDEADDVDAEETYTRYSRPVYDETPVEAVYPPTYPQPRERYEERYVPSYRTGSERTPYYVNERRTGYPKQYSPVAKSVQSPAARQYEMAPEQTPSIYRNQYQKQLSYVDSLYEPYEYEKILDQVQYSQSQLPFNQQYGEIVGQNEARYDGVSNDYSTTTTLATDLAKQDQSNTTSNDNGQTPYIKVAVLPDKDIMVVIEGKNSGDSTNQASPSASPSTENQDPYKANAKPAEEGQIIIPVANTESIMATYVDSKPEANPTETIAKLSATKRRSKSPMRLKASKKHQNHSLKDLVRSYLKSKSN